MDLNFEEEHVVGLDDFPQLEEVLVEATFEVIDQVAARVPVVCCSIEYFELDECCLTSLHCGVIFVSGIVLLLGNMLNLGKSLHRVLFLGEE